MNAYMRYLRARFRKLGETANRVCPYEPDFDPDPPKLLTSRCARRSGIWGWVPHTDKYETGHCTVCGCPVRRA